MNIEEVDLNLTISTDKVGIVFLQSNADLTDIEPYNWKNRSTQDQIDAIKHTLAISKLRDHGAARTHFTIFPEYSIPGLSGFQVIEDTVQSVDWPSDTVVLAGMDGLTVTDFNSLCSQVNTSVAGGSAVTDIAGGHWINCFILWVKCSDGQIRKFIQTKLSPAWEEQSIQCERMHCGSSVFLFKSKFDNDLVCRFLSLICYDWIGKDSSSNPIYKIILQSLSQKFPTDGIDLHWMFVLQHNPKPNHPTFLTVAKEFFEDRGSFPKVNRDNCAVAFVNNAGSPNPSECDSYGHSALVFSPQISSFRIQGCPPTFSGAPTVTRGTDILNACKDVVFRERGACVHSISLQPPRFLAAGATGRQLPLTCAHVHPIKQQFFDPRVPAGPVPGVVKWLNDKIEVMPTLGSRHALSSLSSQSKSKFSETSSTISKQQGQILAKKMSYAVAPVNERHSDKWKNSEIEALRTMLDTITIFGLANPIDADTQDAHADVSIDGQTVNLISTSGQTHEECRKHFDNTYPKLSREHQILVTRDEDNTPITGREHKVTDTSRNLSESPAFIDPAAGVLHLDFSSVLRAFNETTDEHNLRIKIHELFKR